jgi:hypothetical protein
VTVSVVAFFTDQVSVVAPPEPMTLGVAAKLAMVGRSELAVVDEVPEEPLADEPLDAALGELPPPPPPPHP